MNCLIKLGMCVGLAAWPALLCARAQTCQRVILYNGKIATMDQLDTMAASVTIDGDRIAAVGADRVAPKHEGCARLIDLKGRRVIPGLIDSHNHIVVVSLRPGHDVRLDVAESIPEVQKLLHEQAAKQAPGSWITAVGGWSPEQFAEKRMPTLGELDAAIAEDPIFLQTGFDGAAVTNSRGKAFLEQQGIQVGEDGSIAANAQAVAAFTALKSLQTVEDQKRGAIDVMAYAASVGLTTSDDKGGPWPEDMAGTKGIADTGVRTNTLNPFTDYSGFLALNREDKMSMRLRIFYYMQDLNAALPFLNTRLNNQYPDFGNDWLKVSGIGERIYSGPFPFPANASPEIYTAAARLIAQRGWAHDEHAAGLADEKAFATVWELVNAETPLAPLRWCLAHVPGIDAQTLGRLQAMGVGVSAAGSRYTATTPPRNSLKDTPPFRLLVKSGIHVGYGSDGGTVSPLDPWPHMYYMVTGRNSAGELVADGQSISRMDALRLYTTGQTWFTKDEDKLGSLEPGKLADVVVLSDDFLDPASVPDEAIKRITSVLTVVGGKVVYDSGVLRIVGPGRSADMQLRREPANSQGES